MKTIYLKCFSELLRPSRLIYRGDAAPKAPDVQAQQAILQEVDQRLAQMVKSGQLDANAAAGVKTSSVYHEAQKPETVLEDVKALQYCFDHGFPEMLTNGRLSTKGVDLMKYQINHNLLGGRAAKDYLDYVNKVFTAMPAWIEKGILTQESANIWLNMIKDDPGKAAETYISFRQDFEKKNRETFRQTEASQRAQELRDAEFAVSHLELQGLRRNLDQEVQQAFQKHYLDQSQVKFLREYYVLGRGELGVNEADVRGAIQDVRAVRQCHEDPAVLKLVQNNQVSREAWHRVLDSIGKDYHLGADMYDNLKAINIIYDRYLKPGVIDAATAAPIIADLRDHPENGTDHYERITRGSR